MRTLANIVFAIVFLVTIGALIAALIGLEVSISAKILIAAVILILVGIFYVLVSIHDTLSELLFAQRASFVSLERSRLSPDDDVPALKILANDLKEEREEKDAINSLSSTNILVGPILYLGIIFVLYVSATIFYEVFVK